MSKSGAIKIENIKPMVEKIVEQKLIELLGDPDDSVVSLTLLYNVIARRSRGNLVVKTEIPSLCSE